MTMDNTSENITDREFTALVRARLVALGHADVSIDRQWVSHDTDEHPFLLNVPVGPEHVVPLKPQNGSLARDGANLDMHVEYFAKALVNLRKAEGRLLKYAQDVQREARTQVAAARALGLDLQLEGVGFKPTYAAHLSGRDWKDAAQHVLAEVTVRNTSFFLQPETTLLLVEEPEDVAAEMRDLMADQRERQARLAEMERLGADLEVDGITLDLLAAHGVDAVEVLRQVWRAQCVKLEVQHLGRMANLSLVSFDGRTTATLILDNAVWNGEHLWFTHDESKADHRNLLGKTLAGLVDHPAIASRTVVMVYPRPEHGGPEMISLDLSDKLLFDADTGRIWSQERLAA